MITRWAPRHSTTTTTTAAAAAVTSLAVRRPAIRPHCRPSSPLPPRRRLLSTSFPPRREERKAPDPRIRDLGRQIADDYATIRDTYGTYAIRPSPLLRVISMLASRNTCMRSSR